MLTDLVDSNVFADASSRILEKNNRSNYFKRLKVYRIFVHSVGKWQIIKQKQNENINTSLWSSNGHDTFSVSFKCKQNKYRRLKHFEVTSLVCFPWFRPMSRKILPLLSTNHWLWTRLTTGTEPNGGRVHEATPLVASPASEAPFATSDWHASNSIERVHIWLKCTEIIWYQ